MGKSCGCFSAGSSARGLAMAPRLPTRWEVHGEVVGATRAPVGLVTKMAVCVSPLALLTFWLCVPLAELSLRLSLKIIVWFSLSLFSLCSSLSFAIAHLVRAAQQKAMMTLGHGR